MCLHVVLFHLGATWLTSLVALMGSRPRKKQLPVAQGERWGEGGRSDASYKMTVDEDLVVVLFPSLIAHFYQCLKSSESDSCLESAQSQQKWRRVGIGKGTNTVGSLES